MCGTKTQVALFGASTGGGTTSATLKLGSSGSLTRYLQIMMNTMGYSLTVDGIFGDNMNNAVKDYQAKKGLTADGIVIFLWHTGHQCIPSRIPDHTISRQVVILLELKDRIIRLGTCFTVVTACIIPFRDQNILNFSDFKNKMAPCRVIYNPCLLQSLETLPFLYRCRTARAKFTVQTVRIAAHHPQTSLQACNCCSRVAFF